MQFFCRVLTIISTNQQHLNVKQKSICHVYWSCFHLKSSTKLQTLYYKLYFRLSALLKQIQYGWGGKGSGNLKDLCEAINKLEYDEVVKHDLMEQLTKWPQTKGFRLQKPNKEILRLLLEAFLSNDISVTKQVNNLESGSSPG